MDTEGVPERLRVLRTKRGLKQAQLADMLGIKQSAYSRYERPEGKITYPSVETLAALAEIYGVTIDFLLLGREADGREEDLTAEERTLLFLFRGCSVNAKLDIISFAGEIRAAEHGRD